jgi:hypothetical protein
MVELTADAGAAVSDVALSRNQDYGYQGSLDAALANVAKSTPEETAPE